MTGLEEPLVSSSYGRAWVSREAKFRLISKRIYLIVNQSLKMHRNFLRGFFTHFLKISKCFDTFKTYNV